jgi:multimeric flavodoxin WrbA
MNVVAILGSPRVGSNSELLADVAIKSTGAEAKKIVLNELHHIRGCQACYSCKSKTEVCVLKDDLAPVLSAAANSDFVILTAPIYIGEITAQQKIFVDRTFSWFKPDFKSNSVPGRLGPGKKLLLITTQGNPDKSIYKRNIDAYINYFKAQGFAAESVVGAGLAEDNVLTARPDLVKEVESKVASLLGK